jgi:hypothetical protein
MISYLYGYGYGFRRGRARLRVLPSFDPVLSASGQPVASAGGFLLQL